MAKFNVGKILTLLQKSCCAHRVQKGAAEIARPVKDTNRHTKYQEEKAFFFSRGL